MPKRKTSPFQEAYERSMKLQGMDGPVDLYIFRPIGFLAAWILSFTRTSPNAVTLASVALGLAAGIAALPGKPEAFLLCALLFQAANILDCADGQLARLTGRGSAEGRIIDGLADGAVNLFVFLGVFLGLRASGRPLAPTLILLLAAGVAKMIACLYYDRAITRYAERMHSSGQDEGYDELEDSRERASAELGMKRVLWTIYSIFLSWQRLGEDRSKRARRPPSAAFDTEEGRRAYSSAMLPLLSFWSFAGPSAQVLYFLVFAIFRQIELYFQFCIVLVAASCVFLIAEQIVDMRLRAYLEGAGARPEKRVKAWIRARRREP